MSDHLFEGVAIYSQEEKPVKKSNNQKNQSPDPFAEVSASRSNASLSN